MIHILIAVREKIDAKCMTLIIGVFSASVRSKKYFDLSRLIGYRPWNGHRTGGSTLLDAKLI